jgi:glutamine amidotransferase
MGNLHSVASAMEHVGAAEVIVGHDHDAIRAADRVIVPGGGGIRDCMSAIRDLGCDQLLDQALRIDKKPVLAICVGMQALMTRSEENDGVDCLDTIPGQVVFFGEHHQDASNERLKVPHMGWNKGAPAKPHPLWHGIETDARFYFVHSYHVVPDDPDVIAAHFEYGLTGCAAIARGNLFATQFHPEKSHQSGLQLLKNFLTWDGTCS